MIDVTTLDNLANKHRPSFFEDVIGQNQYVRLFQEVVAKDKHHLVKSMFISGPPGIGKTSLAMLYAKATLCLNRKEGEYEPCGVCDVCTGKDLSSIHHYTISTASEAKTAIEQLADIARQLPTPKQEVRKDQYRRFIILDESQKLSPEAISILLDILESQSISTTTWILISMDPQKLEKRDPIVSDAITSRCVEINLSPIPLDSISSRLTTIYHELEEEAADRIAYFSSGNMREAWNILGLLLTSFDIKDITENIVLKYKIGDIDTLDITNIWRYINQNNQAKLSELLSKWESRVTNSNIAANLLIEDLMRNSRTLTEHGLLLIKSISQWQLSNTRYPLKAAIMPYLGKSLFIEEYENREEEITTSKSKLSVQAILAKTKLANNLNPLEGISTLQELYSLVKSR